MDNQDAGQRMNTERAHQALEEERQRLNTIVLYADDPIRAEELARIERLKKLKRFWTVAFVALQGTGVFVLSFFIPPPYLLLIALVWVLSGLAALLSEFQDAERRLIKRDHYWQTRLDDISIKLKETFLNQLDHMDSQLEEVKGNIDLYTQRQLASLDQIRETVSNWGDRTLETRRRGRPGLTEEEIAHRREIVETAAKLQSDNPGLTQKEVAARLKVSERTLSRWKTDYPPAIYPKKS